MGRKRIHFSPVQMKKITCKTCGKEWICSGDAIEVQCDLCMLGAKRIDPNAPIPEVVETPKVKGKRGRPRKNPLPVSTPTIKEEIVEVTTPENKIKRGRGRPRKNPLPIEEKGKAMNKVEKKVDVKNGTGKRGRKATVGSAVLGFIKEQKGEVKFTDILNVYSAEREKLGKKATPEIESRNCHSTLYVMVRDGKIREVTKKSVYAAC